MVAKVAKTGGARLLRPWLSQRQSPRSTPVRPDQISSIWSDKRASKHQRINRSKNHIDQFVGNDDNLLHRLTVELRFDLFVGEG